MVGRIVEESYGVLCDVLERYPQFRCTMNVTGSLTEQLLRYGHEDVLERLMDAVERGQVELLGSAQYHPILALLPIDEARRQIELNTATNSDAFGSLYSPSGFWIPELCYNDSVLPLVQASGINWIVIDPITIDHALPSPNARLRIAGSELYALVRNRAVSDAFFIPTVNDATTFFAHLNKHHDRRMPLVTAFDGENIGHHRPENTQMLKQLIESNEFEFCTASELFAQLDGGEEEIQLRASSWASQASEIESGVPYVLWQDAINDIHAGMWKYLSLVYSTVQAHTSDEGYAEARTRMDERWMSDQFWWASAKPWWDAPIVLRMIELAAEVVSPLSSLTPAEHDTIASHKNTLIQLVRDWERSGHAKQIRAQYMQTYITYEFMAGHKIQ